MKARVVSRRSAAWVEEILMRRTEWLISVARQHDVRIEGHGIPDLTEPEDALVRVTCATVCGSDLQLYNGETSAELRQRPC